jgi:hypothetical protein
MLPSAQLFVCVSQGDGTHDGGRGADYLPALTACTPEGLRPFLAAAGSEANLSNLDLQLAAMTTLLAALTCDGLPYEDRVQRCGAVSTLGMDWVLASLGAHPTSQALKVGMGLLWTACWGAPARVALLPALPCVQEALEGHKCSLEVVLQALSFLRQLAASPDCKVCVAWDASPGQYLPPACFHGLVFSL